MIVRSALPVALLLGSALFATPLSSQSPGDGEDPAEWRLLGSFSGSTTAGFGQTVTSLLHEIENEGDLYKDLGALSIGLGFSPHEDADLDWDNYFTRRVYPLHDELPPGAELTEDHLSSYLDLQTLVTRKRARYDYVPHIFDDRGLGIVVEGGVSLSLGRARPPVQLGERRLSEVLAEREDDTFRAIALQFDNRPEDVVSLGAKGARAVTQWIADGVGTRADTERGTLFWESYGDPVTLGLDVGLPVKVEMFAAEDARLAPGDRIRHLKFVGISPIAMFLEEYGVRAGVEHFYRYLRDTTIVEEAGGTVLVRVRNLSRVGVEVVPFKYRPEVKILDVITLGHTVFEQRWNRGRIASSELAYRVDLNHPRGRESLAALLGDGAPVSFRPLQAAAFEGQGVEALETEFRRGRGQQSIRRFDISSPLRYVNRKTTSTQRIHVDDGDYRELIVGRSRDLSKAWGRDRRSKQRFLARAVAEEPAPGLPPSAASRAVGISLLTTVEDRMAEAEQIWRIADMLAVLGNGRQPALDVFSNVPDDGPLRALANVELSLGRHHLRRLRSVDEDAAWGVLAEILLGPAHRAQWQTSQRRRFWRKRWVRTEFAETEAPEIDDRPNPTRRRLSVHGRFELARRVVKRFRLLQRFLSDGECLSCVHRAASKWEHVTTLQLMLYKLAEAVDGPPPGYRYEVYSENMLRPATVTNGVSYDVTGRFVDAAPELRSSEQLTTEEFERRVYDDTGDWTGRKSFIQPSADRLQAGLVYQQIEPAASADEPCWKLRLFTDYHIAAGLQLRVDLREAREVRKDRFLNLRLLELEEPTEILETPFMTARYYYDVALPPVSLLQPGEPYTLLVRILNSDGFAVTEEQQVLFRWPEGEASQACGPTVGSG